MNFSVLISVYEKDHPQHFGLAMTSIFEQTVEPAEVVLVVDGPVPARTRELIEEFKQQHANLKVFWLEKNMGHGTARRTALENCSNELVAVMDSDDISVRDRFEKELCCFERDSELSVVGGYICEFEGNPENAIGIRTVPLEDREIKRYLKTRCPFNQMSVMFRKTHVDQAGGYRDWHCEEDYYLWIRMFLHGAKFMNLPENLVHVRMDPSSYMRRGGWRYFKSEAALQCYMHRNGVIGAWRTAMNIAVRLVVQLLIPNRLRKWMFKKFFRSQKEK